jgi:hypothetical protein
MTFTNQTIKYENGKMFAIYSKMTKTGKRYYRYSIMQMRYFPISESEINKYIVFND